MSGLQMLTNLTIMLGEAKEQGCLWPCCHGSRRCVMCINVRELCLCARASQDREERRWEILKKCTELMFLAPCASEGVSSGDTFSIACCYFSSWSGKWSSHALLAAIEWWVGVWRAVASSEGRLRGSGPWPTPGALHWALMAAQLALCIGGSTSACLSVDPSPSNVPLHTPLARWNSK